MNSQLTKYLTLFIFILMVGFGTSCKTTIQLGSKNAPPGQVKKATGSQSAKPYAPGQQKKKKN
jgi:hypothetical protein